MRDRERTASDIASHFSTSRSAVSQHLRVLSEADLVTVRPEGTKRKYRARPEGLNELSDWMKEFWTASLQALKVEVEREEWIEKKKRFRKKRTGGNNSD